MEIGMKGKNVQQGLPAYATSTGAPAGWTGWRCAPGQPLLAARCARCTTAQRTPGHPRCSPAEMAAASRCLFRSHDLSAVCMQPEGPNVLIVGTRRQLQNSLCFTAHGLGNLSRHAACLQHEGLVVCDKLAADFIHQLYPAHRGAMGMSGCMRPECGTLKAQHSMRRASMSPSDARCVRCLLLKSRGLPVLNRNAYIANPFAAQAIGRCLRQIHLGFSWLTSQQPRRAPAARPLPGTWAQRALRSGAPGSARTACTARWCSTGACRAGLAGAVKLCFEWLQPRETKLAVCN